MKLTSINDYNTVPCGTVPQDEKTTDIPHPGAPTLISAPGLTSSATNAGIKNEKIGSIDVKNMHPHRDSNPGPWNAIPISFLQNAIIEYSSVYVFVFVCVCILHDNLKNNRSTIMKFEYVVNIL